MTDQPKDGDATEDVIEAIRLAAEDVGLDFTKALAFMARFGNRDAQLKLKRAQAEAETAVKH